VSFHYGVLLASARGLGINPAAVIDALLSAPGLEPRGVRSQDKRVPLKRSREVLVESLASRPESWSVDLENASRGSWGWAMAERLVASNLNNFDVLGVGAEAEDAERLVGWFQSICEASLAECAFLDTEGRIRALGKIPLRSELHKGLPGVAWLTWFGSQVLAAAPELTQTPPWDRVLRTPVGVLCMAGEQPPDDARLAALRTALGQWLHPHAISFKFDLSEKNTVTPGWLVSDRPPGGIALKARRRR
jgi:hypothetical protein